MSARSHHAFLNAGGVLEISRWSSERSERKPPDQRQKKTPAPEGAAEIPCAHFPALHPGRISFRNGDSVVFASLDHRLISIVPPGHDPGFSQKSTSKVHGSF